MGHRGREGGRLKWERAGVGEHRRRRRTRDKRMIGRARFSRLPVCFYTNFVGFRLIFFVGLFWLIWRINE
jgi:hypothetical protein